MSALDSREAQLEAALREIRDTLDCCGAHRLTKPPCETCGHSEGPVWCAGCIAREALAAPAGATAAQEELTALPNKWAGWIAHEDNDQWGAERKRAIQDCLYDLEAALRPARPDAGVSPQTVEPEWKCSQCGGDALYCDCKHDDAPVPPRGPCRCVACADASPSTGKWKAGVYNTKCPKCGEFQCQMVLSEKDVTSFTNSHIEWAMNQLCSRCEVGAGASELSHHSLLSATVAWWRGHRPSGWSTAEHLANPAINAQTDRDKRLMQKIAEIVASPSPREAAPCVWRATSTLPAPKFRAACVGEEVSVWLPKHELATWKACPYCSKPLQVAGEETTK